MKQHFFPHAALYLFLLASSARADTKTSRWQDANMWHLSSAFPATLLQRSTASITPQNIKDVLHALHPVASMGTGKTCPAMEAANPSQLDWRDGDTFVLHVAAWGKATKDAKNPAAGNSASIQIDKQNWYVYQASHTSDEDVTMRKRIFGAKRIWLVYIQVQIDTDGGLAYDVAYESAVKSKTPAYLNDLIGLLALFKGSTGAGGAPPTEDLTTRWGAHCFDSSYVPSDVTLTPHFLLRASTGSLNFGTAGSELNGPKAETFDNEGLYRFDFSVGVPLTKIKDLQYVSTSNTLTATTVNQQNIYALADYYFQPVDIKNLGFSWYPHALAGVKVGSQPLKKAIIGIGYGPALAHFYFGLVLNTTTVPKGTGCGVTPAPVAMGTAFTTRTCPEFGWGLNIGVGAAANALKKK